MRTARWFSRNRDWVIPAVILVLMVVILVGQQAQRSREHDATFATCERTNAARLASVHNLEGDVRTLKAELTLWEAVEAATPASAQAASPPAVTAAFSGNVDAIRRGIGRKEHAITSAIAAQAPVAVRPGSPVDNCNLAT